jgi:hypothetical protein
MVENSKKLGITDSATRIYDEARKIIGWYYVEWACWIKYR